MEGNAMAFKRFLHVKLASLFLVPAVAVLLSTSVLAAVGGSISGTIKDSTGGVVPGTLVTVTNSAIRTEFKTMTDARGYFSFPNLAVGTWDLSIELSGFKPQKKNGLVIDVNTALELNATLEVASVTQEVSVSTDLAAESVQVDTVSTQLGEVVTGVEMTTVALNGRSFTDLLALQPGIVPMTTQQPDSIVMAGASVAIQPSGGLNPGNQSISGQREDANGFLINGGDVKELMNGGTSIVPNLDSIHEFRVLTNNFDPEYGNYSGGVVNVVTKSGANQVHGSGFEFLRNTALDARNFFSPAALMWAAGDPEKVRVLLEHGADATAKAESGRTPLIVASTYVGNVEAVWLLLARGADAKVLDRTGDGPVGNAASARDAA